MICWCHCGTATPTRRRFCLCEDEEEASITELIQALEGLPALTTFSHGNTSDRLVEALCGRLAITALDLGDKVSDISDTAVRQLPGAQVAHPCQ